jgi:hypothetical protein
VLDCYGRVHNALTGFDLTNQPVVTDFFSRILAAPLTSLLSALQQQEKANETQ